MTFTTRMLQNHLAVFLIAISLLSGCQSAPDVSSTAQEPVVPTALHYYPADAQFIGNDIVDIQLALGDRDLYLSQTGQIKMLSIKQCPMDISAHRGDFRQPESSDIAIASALRDNYNSVEIDVRLLKDGTWVNHHDQQTGRATVHYTGKRYNIEKMKLNEFVQLKLRDKQNHQLLNRRPITALESFQTFATYRKNNQKLNVEIKSETYGQKLYELDQMLRQTVGQGSFYYSSSDLDTLEKLRGINPTVYLGFIQGAHPSSVEKLQRDLRQGLKNDAFYLDNQNNLELVGKYGTKRYRSRYKNYTTNNGLNQIKKTLGSNSGLHLDIRSFMQNPSIKAQANNAGMKIYTYTINGSNYHQTQLLSLSKSNLPDGAIVDATPLMICQKLFSPAKTKRTYQAQSDLGRYIMTLPNDANFDEFEQMLGYQSEGYYISLNSGLRPIRDAQKTATPRQRSTSPKQSTQARPMFPTIVDEKIDTSTTDTIILTLPNNKNER